MNNEPVAWIKKKEIGYMEVTKKCGAKDYATNLRLVPEDDDIPLYTHPVKELTKDMLWELAEKHLDTDDTWKESNVTGIDDFIVAILKKAQK